MPKYLVREPRDFDRKEEIDVMAASPMDAAECYAAIAEELGLGPVDDEGRWRDGAAVIVTTKDGEENTYRVFRGFRAERTIVA